MQAVRPGATIRVVEKQQMRSRSGELLQVAADSVTFRVSGLDVNIPKAEIARVSVERSGRRLRNILIGAGIGAASGLLDNTIGTYLRNETDPEGARAVLWGVPLAAGVGIGAVLPTSKTVYRSSGSNKP